MRLAPVIPAIASLFLLYSCAMVEEGTSRKLKLSDDWRVQSSEKTIQPGEVLSTADATVAGWYNATVPSTIMGVLTSNGQYADILEGINYRDIDSTRFDHSWWYRTEFQLPELTKNEHTRLIFEGLSYSANVWLNGEKIVSFTEFQGPFRPFTFYITNHVAEHNVLAVEVFRARPGDPNIHYADLSPAPADASMGIFRDVRVEVSGRVEMKSPVISTRVNTQTLGEAWITLATTLVNHSDSRAKGDLTGRFGDASFSVPVSLEAGEEKEISLTADDVPALYVPNPRVWWCNKLGTPEMYEMNLQFVIDEKTSDSLAIPFAIRELKDYMMNDTVKGFVLNGRKVLLKSAAWTEDIFMRDTPETNEIQVAYARDMNLNSISFATGWDMPQNMYELCDKYGLIALSVSDLAFQTGIKTQGPYEYVGPSYWYEDTQNGGAYGFNNGSGIGAQLPVVESIRRMIPEDKLWPLNEYWDYHTAVSAEGMNNLSVLTGTIEHKYGKPGDLNDFLRKADLLNYEGTKAMFEAFRVNVRKSTGVVQWMLNPAWPSLYWQMYDHYLIPTAAYYGVKKANQPQQLIYNYKDNSIYYVDEILTPVQKKARISIYDVNSELLHEALVDFRVESDCSKKIFALDEIVGNVFLSLQLLETDETFISRNFYCLSGTKDEYDWENTNRLHTPLTAYADFKALSSLAPADLEIVPSLQTEGEGNVLEVVLTNNTPVISLMTRLVLKDANGDILYPVLWDDNYISILPGETRTVKCTWEKTSSDVGNPTLHVSGWNLGESKVVEL